MSQSRGRGESGRRSSEALPAGGGGRSSSEAAHRSFRSRTAAPRISPRCMALNVCALCFALATNVVTASVSGIGVHSIGGTHGGSPSAVTSADGGGVAHDMAAFPLRGDVAPHDYTPSFNDNPIGILGTGSGLLPLPHPADGSGPRPFHDPGDRVDDVVLNGTIRSLNALGSARARRPLLGGGDFRTTPAHAHHSLAVSSVQRRLKECGPPPPSVDAAQALRDLSKSGSTVRLDRDATVRPYDPDRVKVVKDGTRPKPLLPLLPRHLRSIAASPRKFLFRPDAELESPQFAWLQHGSPDNDPALRVSVVRAHFVSRL